MADYISDNVDWAAIDTPHTDDLPIQEHLRRPNGGPVNSEPYFFERVSRLTADDHLFALVPDY
jgi:hypothetical protein